jgi:hypothetical protein
VADTPFALYPDEELNAVGLDMEADEEEEATEQELQLASGYGPSDGCSNVERWLPNKPSDRYGY